MGPEVEVNKRSKAKMESSTYKTYGNLAQELEDELMKFTPTYEESKVGVQLVEKNEKVHKNVDVEVDIIKRTKSGGKEVVEPEHHDTTGSLSSFEGSGSEDENDGTMGDSEALSNFNGDSESAPGFDGFGEMFRPKKKKVTAHWRSYIQPLMWRCKWVELQIKKFESQAQRYERQLEKCSSQKNVPEKSMLEDNGVKSLPFLRKNAKSEVLRRKKRNRIEATKDVAEYMSNHTLFSYYENRKFFNKGAFMENELKNPAKAAQKVNINDNFWVNDDLLCLESGDGDSSFEQVLQKIEYLQSRVGKLKNKAEKVIDENVVDISYLENLVLPMPSKALISSSQSTSSHSYNEKRMAVGTIIASQLISEYNMGSKIEPESEMITHEGIVSKANGSRTVPLFACPLSNGGDGALINKQKVKEEVHDYEPIQRSLVLRDESGSTAPVTEESKLPAEDQPPPKTRSIAKLTAPKTQARRGRRRGTGRWGRRYT
ncbi:hypothetical protein ACJIZ3_016262 [Penstemon smallii]|uniref:Uncharacterized protein n=1 Tax=Penstemon smallii TaxID=265156 RepID=A0ABD3RQN3_9LAMI